MLHKCRTQCLLAHWVYNSYTVIPSYLCGVGFRTTPCHYPTYAKIYRCSSSLCKTAEYLRVIYMHLPAYLNHLYIIYNTITMSMLCNKQLRVCGKFKFCSLELAGNFFWIFLICNWICEYRTYRYRAPTILSHILWCCNSVIFILHMKKLRLTCLQLGVRKVVNLIFLI